jgi:hypothetical protein
MINISVVLKWCMTRMVAEEGKRGRGEEGQQ